MRGQIGMGVEGRRSRNELSAVYWNGSHFLGNFILGNCFHSKTEVSAKPIVGLPNTSKDNCNEAVSWECN